MVIGYASNYIVEPDWTTYLLLVMILGPIIPLCTWGLIHECTEWISRKAEANPTQPHIQSVKTDTIMISYNKEFTLEYYPPFKHYLVGINHKGKTYFAIYDECRKEKAFRRHTDLTTGKELVLELQLIG